MCCISMNYKIDGRARTRGTHALSVNVHAAVGVLAQQRRWHGAFHVLWQKRDSQMPGTRNSQHLANTFKSKAPSIGYSHTTHIAIACFFYPRDGALAGPEPPGTIAAPYQRNASSTGRVATGAAQKKSFGTGRRWSAGSARRLSGCTSWCLQMRFPNLNVIHELNVELIMVLTRIRRCNKICAVR